MRTAIDTDDAPRSDSPISQAVRAGDTVYVSGQVPRTADGDIVNGDLGVQTERTLDNLEAVLAAAGLTLADVVKVTVFLTDLSDFDAFNDAYRRRFAAPMPARSAVAVADLAVDADVEIEAVAVEPDRAAGRSDGPN
ncbi:RidA family protein [Haloparvum alkalitolerans]|uniref:RidA family protein n=1 Tax=Haloparvum alkalitolerans TaxID=1042953 RepID=UPI003CE6C20B